LYKPSTDLVVNYYSTYVPIYETYFLDSVTKVKPNINSVEVYGLGEPKIHASSMHMPKSLTFVQFPESACIKDL
jgi:hypothetical protein